MWPNFVIFQSLEAQILKKTKMPFPFFDSGESPTRGDGTIPSRQQSIWCLANNQQTVATTATQKPSALLSHLPPATHRPTSTTADCSVFGLPLKSLSLSHFRRTTVGKLQRR